METLVQKEKYTVEDYMSLPEGAPYQLIQGKLIMSPAPKKLHQEKILDLASEIRFYLKRKKIGKCYIAPLDVHLDNENILQPDICFISSENMKNFRDGYFYGAPDLVIEILSPSSMYYDTKQKLKLYEKFGVSEYFIIDPEDNEVVAYYLEEGKYKEQYLKTGVLTSTILNNEFRLD